jgi:hypothetical protein
MAAVAALALVAAVLLAAQPRERRRGRSRDWPGPDTNWMYVDGWVRCGCDHGDGCWRDCRRS